MAKTSVRDQLIVISQDYLGPAAERYLDRQITTHLDKDPRKITREDLVKLIDWITLSFSVLTDDDNLVEEYTRRLTLVANGKWFEAIGKRWAQN